MEPGQAAAAGLTEEQRPLTDEGRGRLTETVGQLQAMEPRIAKLLASPLERARQSAEIIAQVYAVAVQITVQSTDLLRPGAAAEPLIGALESFAGAGAPLALVGHEPDLGNLAGWWLCARAARQVRFEKGSIACVEFEGAPAPGSGRLRYLLPGLLPPR